MGRFILWLRYPVDLGHNFVMAHATCNAKKSDRLAATEHLDRWVAHQERHAADLAREYDRCRIASDLGSSVRIVSWAYTQTFEARGSTWVRGNEMQTLLPRWVESLGRLMCCR